MYNVLLPPPPWRDTCQLGGPGPLSFNTFVSEGLALLFLNRIFMQNLPWSHVNRTLSGVSFFLKLQILPSLFSFFTVRQALKGYRKLHHAVDSRRPKSTEVLVRLCEVSHTVCWSEFEVCLFKSVFSTAFFAALRISELLPPAKLRQGGLQ